MAKVSILVAVWNAEAWLDECLRSLLAQTLDDIQVVCVDDASTDRSWQMLEHYARQDSRIEVLHLDSNSGQAHARNVALQQARGQYVCFLDSDDFLAPDALEKAVAVFEQHKQTDSVLFRLCYCAPDGTPTQHYAMSETESLTGMQAFKDSLTWKIHGVYMVRAEIHKRFPYDESARTYSDDNTTRLHYLHSCEVRFCQGTYYYRQHGTSVTHRISASRFDYLKANASMKAQLLEEQTDDEVLNIYENERWLNCIGLYMFYCRHRRELSAEARRYGMQTIRSTWESIEPHRLRKRNRYKLGYVPFHGAWHIFRLQEEVYFLLREAKNVLKKMVV